MSTLDSILELLQKWPAWKSITGAPKRVDELEQRVHAIEAALARSPGKACPKCGALSMRAISETTDSVFEVMGVRRRLYRCEACGFETRVQIGPDQL